MATLLLAAPAAPAQSPGPALQEPVTVLESALECTADLDAADKTPVLLVHGTWTNPEESWSWGYRRVLPDLGYPTCTVTLPERALVDHQRSVEYVVHAIRRIAARSGRSILLLGHSQGAVHGVYALRFWPDLAAKVEDFVGLASLHRGTQAADTLCQLRCPPANWQQRRDSKFTAAINVPPHPHGPSYTSIYTQYDIVATPSAEVAPLEGASNILIQDLCPVRPVDHVGLLGDAVVYRLVIDALANEGPADPARAGINCLESFMPGADLVGIPTAMASFAAAVAQTPLYPGNTEGEPPLRCYLRPAGDCEPKAVVHSRIDCDGKPATISGTPGDDVLRGTNGPDVIAGLGGDDKIKGFGGNDLLCGGGGADIIKGANGADRIFGQGGPDRLFGGAGKDSLRGGSGKDKIFGDGNRDDLKGNRGDDKMGGGGGNDILRGNKGNDKLFGQGGKDVCKGGAKADSAKTCEVERSI